MGYVVISYAIGCGYWGKDLANGPFSKMPWDVGEVLVNNATKIVILFDW